MNFPIEFRVVPAEWTQFWKWVGANTGAHHIGPNVTVTYPRNPKLEEVSMQFYLEYKDLILNNPPVCTCGHNILVGNHKDKCPKEIFHRLAMKIRTK